MWWIGIAELKQRPTTLEVKVRLNVKGGASSDFQLFDKTRVRGTTAHRPAQA